MLKKNLKHIQRNSNFGQLVLNKQQKTDESEIQDDAQFKKDMETELEKVIKNDQKLKSLSIKDALNQINSNTELKKKVLKKIIVNTKTKKLVKQIGGMLGIDTSDLENFYLGATELGDSLNDDPDFKSSCDQNT